MKELIRVRVQYASRQQCCKTHKRPLPFTFRLTKCQYLRRTNNTILYNVYIPLAHLVLYKLFPVYRNTSGISLTFTRKHTRFQKNKTIRNHTDENSKSHVNSLEYYDSKLKHNLKNSGYNQYIKES